MYEYREKKISVQGERKLVREGVWSTMSWAHCGSRLFFYYFYVVKVLWTDLVNETLN